MKYLSTRGDPARRSFCEILLEGLAPDGGLYLPEHYPQVDAAMLGRWRGLSYAELAFEILSLYIDDIPAADLRRLCTRTYTEAVFGSPEIVPLTLLRDATSPPATPLYLQALSNGPTLAFKDMAMQLLGNLFEYELARRGEELNILGATSGDTGSAAEYAMRGKKGVRVFMTSPHGRMSPFQQAQMFSLQDENIHNIAIEGVFDDCQDIVKAVSNDLDFKRKYRIGTVNSINWARLLAQVVYYFAGWFQATSIAAPATAEGDRPAAGPPQGGPAPERLEPAAPDVLEHIRTGDRGEASREPRPARPREPLAVGSVGAVSFAVPSGNFGNICAGHVARMMGLPIERLVLATNENDVLDEFFRTGIYRVRTGADTHETSSPSMDISKASNFERFAFDLLGRDADRVRDLFGTQLARHGRFDLSTDPAFDQAATRYGFASGSSTHADRLRTIRETFARFGKVIDTHTADGLKVAQQWLQPGVPMIVLETALPIKFAGAVVEALGREPDRPPRFEGIENLPRRVTVMPADAVAVKAFIAAHCA